MALFRKAFAPGNLGSGGSGLQVNSTGTTLFSLRMTQVFFESNTASSVGGLIHLVDLPQAIVAQLSASERRLRPRIKISIRSAMSWYCPHPLAPFDLRAGPFCDL